MTRYRRFRSAAVHDPWHFCRDCSDDLKVDFDLRYDQPPYDELCHQCKTGRIDSAKFVQNRVGPRFVPSLPGQSAPLPAPPTRSILVALQLRLLSAWRSASHSGGNQRSDWAA
jgi:hypothetical protein